MGPMPVHGVLAAGERIQRKAWTGWSCAQAKSCMLLCLSLIHISEPTRPLYISYAVFCLKKKK